MEVIDDVRWGLEVRRLGTNNREHSPEEWRAPNHATSRSCDIKFKWKVAGRLQCYFGRVMNKAVNHKDTNTRQLMRERLVFFVAPWLS
jgi:hypothetical protein